MESKLFLKKPRGTKKVQKNGGGTVSDLFQFIEWTWFLLTNFLFGPTPKQEISLRWLTHIMSPIFKYIWKINYCEYDSDFAGAFLLVLDAQSNDQENGCQAVFEQESKNMVLHLARRSVIYICDTQKQWETRNCQAYSSTLLFSLQSPCSVHIQRNPDFKVSLKGFHASQQIDQWKSYMWKSYAEIENVNF